VHAGVEVKVSDAIDSLFDVIKLATGLAEHKLDEGFCVVAADAPHWASGGTFTAMTQGPFGMWHPWTPDELLSRPRDRAAVLVSKGPRPRTAPARIETMATEPVAMPNAPTHELRIIAVRVASDVVHAL
jgi:hypothetical protein